MQIIGVLIRRLLFWSNDGLIILLRLCESKIGSDGHGSHFWLEAACAAVICTVYFCYHMGSDGRLCYGYFCLFIVIHCLLFKVLFPPNTDYGISQVQYFLLFMAGIILNVEPGLLNYWLGILVLWLVYFVAFIGQLTGKHY